MHVHKLLIFFFAQVLGNQSDNIDLCSTTEFLIILISVCKIWIAFNYTYMPVKCGISWIYRFYYVWKFSIVSIFIVLLNINYWIIFLNNTSHNRLMGIMSVCSEGQQHIIIILIRIQWSILVNPAFFNGKFLCLGSWCEDR